MPVLTYARLDDAVQVGQPLGCDSTGWPYQVVAVEHVVGVDIGPEPGDGVTGATLVTVEPWPLLQPNATRLEREAHNAALHHASHRRAGWIR